MRNCPRWNKSAPGILLSLLFCAGLLACQLPVSLTGTVAPTLAQPTLTVYPTAIPSSPAAAGTATSPGEILSPTNTHIPAPAATPGRKITVEGLRTEPSARTVTDVKIFLVALEDGGKSGKAVGCADSLIAVNRTVNPTDQPIQAALADLFAIKEQQLGQSGLYNAIWQSNLQVLSATVNGNGTATVAITGQVMLGGECDTPRFEGQILETILAAPGVKDAAVFLNGKPIEQALSLK